jgi:hypothetical protein
MTHQAAAAGVPALGGWRTVTIALGCALVIGGIGGLIGLGGDEFRLPLLVGLIGFTARAAVPMNQILSLITLVTALIVRWHTGSLVGVGAFAVAVVALGLGGVTAAWASRLCATRGAQHRRDRPGLGRRGKPRARRRSSVFQSSQRAKPSACSADDI